MRYLYALLAVILLGLGSSVAFATEDPGIDDLGLDPSVEIVKFKEGDLEPGPVEVKGFKITDWEIVKGPYVRTDGSSSDRDRIHVTMVPEEPSESTRDNCFVFYDAEDPYRAAWGGYFAVGYAEVTVGSACPPIGWYHKIKELDGGYWITHATNSELTPPGQTDGDHVSTGCSAIPGLEDWMNWTSGAYNPAQIRCNKSG